MAAIAARARHLDERLLETSAGDGRGTGEALVGDPFVAEAWRRWCRAFAQGSEEALRRRLAWDGFDAAAARRALASRSDAFRDLPAWTGLLARALALGSEMQRELGDRRRSAEPELFEEPPPPFVDLCVPFLRGARERVDAGRLRRTLAPPALAAFERDLLGELSAASALAFYDRFAALRRRRRRGSYAAFVAEMLDGGMCRLFEESSLLARQLTALAATWAEALDELLERLERDAAAIQQAFGWARPPGPMVAAEPSLSERHDGGRRVTKLVFAAGHALIYKPRDVGLEAAYQGFLAWIAERGFEHPPPRLEVLPRDGYGWVEEAVQSPARSAPDVAAYYAKGGALLALAYVLNASDLHMDNVVATAAGPVVVDAETFCQPRRAASRPAARTAIERARDELEASVLSSGLLSFHQADPMGRIYDAGGLAGRGGHLVPTLARTWSGAGTDDLRPAESPVRGAAMANVLELDGEVQDPADHAGALAGGCGAMLRFLAAHRGELLAPQGPLADFGGKPTRLVFRSSNLYALILQRLTTPRFQGHGLAGSFLVESLARPFRATEHRPQLWPLIVAERRSLQNLDVPRFTLGTGDVELEAAGETVGGMFVRSGLEVVRERLAALDEARVEEQVAILRAALGRRRHGAGDSVTELCPTPLAPLAPADLVAAAERIARRLHQQAIRGDDGSAVWISPEVLRLAGRSDRGGSYHLYGGGTGVALFLAALAAVHGGDEHRELARSACRPVEKVLASADVDKLLRRETLGVCSGLGSVVFGLTAAARLLGDSELHDLALRSARQVTPERIAADRTLDVEGGAAGALLALLALYDLDARPWILERAAACGRHLVAAASPAAGGRGMAWRGGDGRQLTGFAHGASGIALALLRLSRSVDDDRLPAAAAAGFEFERRRLDRKAGAWGAAGLAAWCHGAPGVALARAAALGLGSDPELVEDLEIALEMTERQPLGTDDSLCCGNLGRVEILLTAGEILGRRDLVAAAHARAAALLRRSRTAAEDGLHPGFFRGASGIGYSWLRLADPRRLPPVLAFSAMTSCALASRARDRSAAAPPPAASETRSSPETHP